MSKTKNVQMSLNLLEEGNKIYGCYLEVAARDLQTRPNTGMESKKQSSKEINLFNINLHLDRCKTDSKIIDLQLTNIHITLASNQQKEKLRIP